MEKNYQVVFAEQNKVVLNETEIPTPGPGEVLFKSVVSQISTGTELTMLEANVEPGSPWLIHNIHYPILPGYSNAGIIVEVGEGIDKNLIGKRYMTDSTHARYSVLNDSNCLYAIPDNVNYDEAVFAVIAQITLGNTRAANIRMGETVVVFGAGLIGQTAARFAKIAGALNVIVADISDFRLNLIPDDSVFTTVNTQKEDILEVIKKLNRGNLADVVFETTGNQSLTQMQLECLTNNGRFIVTSSPKGKSIIDLDYCSRMGITIIGAHNWAVHPEVATSHNPWTKHRDSEYFLQLLEKNQLSVKNLITHRANFKDAVDMYKMLVEDRTRAMAVHLYWEDDKTCL
ncbi:MAG: zinc-binding alcohol dehydrogenase [Clostridia bacterium]|nr:zinc-binding alcohol dehydrogenase [Clostridia bacterium]